MPDALIYAIAGFFGLIVVVRGIIDATMKINLQVHERNQQVTGDNEMRLELGLLNRALNTTLSDFRTDLREIRAQTASQQTLEHVAKYLVEMRQQLGVLSEMSTLSKLNTGKIANIERLIIALHATLESDTPNSGMIQIPFPMPGMSGMPGMPGMGPGGMWKPLGIKREDGKYKTEDGEHEADSLEELLAKLTSDPQYRIDPNFKRINPADIENMRKMFEEQIGEEDDDDEKEDWQKKGEEE